MPQDHRVQAQVQADTGGAPQTPAALTTNAGDPDIGELVLNFVELDDKADFLELWDAIQFNYGDGFDRQNLTVEDFNLLGAFITKFPVFQQQVDELREPTAICEQSSETDESQPDEPFWRLAERTFMYAYWHDALHQEDFERFVLNIGKHATFRRDYFRERRSQRARVAALIADEESDRRFEMNEDLIGSLMYEDCIRVFDADPRDMSEDAKANVVNAFKVLYDHPHFVFQMNERLRTIYGLSDTPAFAAPTRVTDHPADNIRYPSQPRRPVTPPLRELDMIRAAKYHRLWETLTNAILDVPQRRYLDEIFQAHPNLEEQLTGDNAVILQRLPQYLDISQPLPDEFDVFTPILRRLDAAMWRACQFFFDEDLDAPPPDIVNHIIVVLHHHTHLLLGLTDKLRREEIAANIVELAARNPKSRQFGQLEKFSRPSDLGVDCEELTDILTKDADRRDYPARDRRNQRLRHHRGVSQDEARSPRRPSEPQSD